MTDYAVVVGIARYPDLFDERTAGDLAGPNNDAQAIHDWLVDPAGGGLDPANVQLVVHLDDLDPDDPQPAVAEVERALKRVEQRTRQTPGGRLYLYFSGHGFAPMLEEGALFAADASQVFPTYVYAHSWLRWFRRAQRFHEFVLWMDCCMNSQQSIPVNEVVGRPKIGAGVPGPAFAALAAQTKSALEREMPDGKAHGVFTWTLLTGLRGGAADDQGRVTGESLRAFLYNVMPEFLPDDARRGASVDLQPFVRADAGLVFQRLPARPTYPVRLALPDAAAGQEVTIWTGRPPMKAATGVVAALPGGRQPGGGPGWSGELVRGLYVAEAPAAGVRGGFQVSGAGPVEATVADRAPAVRPPGGADLFQLDVVAGNPAATITVTDHRFERIFTDTGELHERSAPGVYKVRIELGRDIAMLSDQVLLLDADVRAGGGPTLPSPAPIPGSSLTHESHLALFAAAADRAAGSVAATAGQCAVSILARYWTGPTDPSAPTDPIAGTDSRPPSAPGPDFPHPLDGLELFDATGRSVARLVDDCRMDAHDGRDPVAIWERELAPGAYYLRQSLPNQRAYEGAVIACPGWVTQLAIRRDSGDVLRDRSGARVAAIGDVAAFMRPVTPTPRPPEQDVVVETARLALVQERDVFGNGRDGGQLKSLLLAKYHDPIAGIIGCHLLLRAMRASRDPAHARLFDAAVANLRVLVGDAHPDVEALSLRCAQPELRARVAFTAPPLFRHSWQLITEASFTTPELLPAALWGRVHAASSVGAFFAWAVDPQTRQAHAEQLSRWITAYAEPAPVPGASAAARRPTPVERPAADLAAVGLGGVAGPARLTVAEGGPVAYYEAVTAAFADHATAGGPLPLPAAAREAAQHLYLPAAAVTDLWADLRTDAAH